MEKRSIIKVTGSTFDNCEIGIDNAGATLITNNNKYLDTKYPIVYSPGAILEINGDYFLRAVSAISSKELMEQIKRFMSAIQDYFKVSQDEHLKQQIIPQLEEMKTQDPEKKVRLMQRISELILTAAVTETVSQGVQNLMPIFKDITQFCTSFLN